MIEAITDYACTTLAFAVATVVLNEAERLWDKHQEKRAFNALEVFDDCFMVDAHASKGIQRVQVVHFNGRSIGVRVFGENRILAVPRWTLFATLTAASQAALQRTGAKR